MSERDAHPNLALIVRGVITIALGVFAFVTGDQAITSLIVGGVLGYWLREGEGRALRRRRAGRRGANDGINESANVTTDRSAP